MITEIIVMTFMYVLLKIVDIFTSIIGALISANSPVINNAVTTMTSFFDQLEPTLAYAISYTMLNKNIMALVLGFWIFALTVQPTIYLYKNLLHWIRTIKIK